MTVIGVGGCGKTRLAIQVASELLAELPAGGVARRAGRSRRPDARSAGHGGRPRCPRRAGPPAGCDACGLDPLGNPSSWCSTTASTSPEDRVRRWRSQLLQTCPNLRILATSQEAPERRRGDHLADPDLERSGRSSRPPTTKEEAERYESVRLFVGRATAALGSFALTDANAAAP